MSNPRLKNPTYISWFHMKARCNRKSYHQYEDYGGRGITYDSRWEKFKNFLADMGERPEGKTLDRYPDKNGNYCKNNCRWATWNEQAINKRIKPPMSGVSGVYWTGRYWRSHSLKIKGSQVVLYQGADLFEAICRRKSYEISVMEHENG